MIASFVVKEVPGAVAGFIIGAFTPALGRKIKALFVKESTAAAIAVETEAAKVEADVKAKV